MSVLLLLCVLATAKVISGLVLTLTVRIHGEFMVLPHLETRLKRDGSQEIKLEILPLIKG